MMETSSCVIALNYKKKKSLPALFERLKLLLMSVAVFPENGLIFSVPVVKPPNRKNHIYDNENNV